MFKRNFCPILLLALLSPTVTLALGLGDIHLKSALNAPLDAEIDLVGASADDLSGLKASLATREAFTHGGLDYPGFLGALSFVPEKTADGRNVLHVHSAEAANEPFATLLVEVDWARGHVVREYTVLIDPPVFSGAEAPAKASVAAPSAGSSARSGTVEHRAAVAPSAAESTPATTSSATTSSAESMPAAAANRSSSGTHAAGSRYTVRPGDTLTAVASQTYPGADRHQRERELVAIYRANPTAFQGNMNLLLSGSRLDLPGDTEIDAISPGEASSEVRRQYSTWAGAHGAATSAHAGNGEAASGQLHLVPPQEAAKTPAAGAPGAAAGAAGAAGTNAGTAGGGNNAALTQRVQELEAQLAESQRLLQLRNADLAAMQARAAQNAANNAAPPTPTAAPKAPAPAVAPTPAPSATTVPPPTPAPAPVASAPSSNAPPAAAPSQPVGPPTPAPAPAAKPSTTPAAATSAESGNSVLDLIEQYWYVPAGLIAILIILVVLRFVRARQEDEFDRSLGRLQPSFETSTSDGVRASDTVPVRTLPASGAETSYRVEETGPHEQPNFDHPAVSAAATSQHVAIDDTVTGERPVALDQGDPLAEADFHMAYGLYDQAADLVQIAISREPERRELKLKLLEVFFVWGNKDRFLQTARELASSRPQALAGEWEKMVIMGRQIAPDDPLFANAGTLTGAASGGVDLNLEGGQNRVDFDLLGEPSVGGSVPETGAGLDLDLGAALGDGDITGQVNKVGDDGVDFVLDDPERGNDSTGSTREMPGAPAANTREMPAQPGAAGTALAKEYTATMRVPGGTSADGEVPTVEQPQLPGGDNSTIREKIGAAARAGMQTSDQTAELALDDLGLDLGALEGLGDETGISNAADAPTMLSNLDEDTRELLARARAEQSGSDATQRAPTSSDGPSDSGTWLFTDTDFANGMAREAGKAAGPSEGEAATQLVTQLSPQLPADMDTASTSSLAALDVSALDLDVGSLGEESSVNGIDLDVGTPSVSEGTFVQTQKIASGDMALPELEPATMSEVGTKLDLARAYMDMGDPEGARSILAEVLSEGSVSQKQEARRLMDTLPG
jgi:pilus assembly protein FimV